MTDEVILTRYLYNYVEVRQSLFISFLNHDIEESLYWAYELYYSGYKNIFIEFLIDIYLILYKLDNPEMEQLFMKQLDILRIDNDELLFGNIIATLATRQYNLQKFCKKYLHIDTIHTISEKKPKLLVNLTKEFIEQYKTKTDNCVYRTLRNVIKYPIRKNMNKLFNASSIFDYDPMRNIYHNEWLYFTRKCPIWSERISEYNGISDDTNKTIVFPSDDEFEEFYEKWNYEPDEQPSHVQTSLMGAKNYDSINIKEFCIKYNLTMKFKKIRTRERK